jgi:ABC-type bacteriocin/lantibiotic exporter with double-glycine peptidase domain
MAMLLVGAFLLVNQLLNIGQFIAAEMVILMVIESVEKLIVNLDKVYDVLTSVEKINKLLEKPKEHTGGTEFINAKGLSIKANDVSFMYPDKQFTLKNLTFEIESGENVCIMGDYSAGKSTLIKLLSCAYTNFDGVLLYNDISIQNFEIDSIRRKMGILLNGQDIIEGSLKENICLGDESITLDHLNDLAELVGLKDFVSSHKEGYDYFLQPTGQHLSGRIARKILLMRALVHKPQLLLLEEPWMGLEEPQVQNIKNYLLHSVSNTTMVVISNDQEFARKCDKVIFMEKGRIKSILKK